MRLRGSLLYFLTRPMGCFPASLPSPHVMLFTVRAVLCAASSFAFLRASPQNGMERDQRNFYMNTDGGTQDNANRKMPGKKDGNTLDVCHCVHSRRSSFYFPCKYYRNSIDKRPLKRLKNGQTQCKETIKSLKQETRCLSAWAFGRLIV